MVSLCRWELVMILKVFSRKCWTVMYVPIVLHFMCGLQVFLSWREDCMMLSPSISLAFAGRFCSYCKLHNEIFFFLYLGQCLIGMQSQLSGWRRHMPYFSIEFLKYRMLLQLRRYGYWNSPLQLENKILYTIIVYGLCHLCQFNFEISNH